MYVIFILMLTLSLETLYLFSYTRQEYSCRSVSQESLGKSPCGNNGTQQAGILPKSLPQNSQPLLFLPTSNISIPSSIGIDRTGSIKSLENAKSAIVCLVGREIDKYLNRMIKSLEQYYPFAKSDNNNNIFLLYYNSSDPVRIKRSEDLVRFTQAKPINLGKVGDVAPQNELHLLEEKEENEMDSGTRFTLKESQASITMV